MSQQEPYQRPGQRWVCGRTGRVCPQGPTSAGQCPHADAPCAPQRSVKSRKRWLALWLLVIATALLAWLLSSDNLMPLLSPGPLSASHAEVADCQSCHSAVEESGSSWIHKAVQLNSNNDDQQCLSCHQLGSNAFKPHSTDLAAWPRLASATQPGAEGVDWRIQLAAKWYQYQHGKDSVAATAETTMSCASCHREHQGKMQPLEHMAAEKCHTCHQRQFGALEESHPEYSSYPRSRSQRIKFDHASHLEKHFNEDEFFDVAPTGCLQCHEIDRTGEWMLTTEFEQTCSSCHLPQILGKDRASAKGIAVLAIPELDVDSLQQAGFDIGEWPESVDGELVPIMKLLLQNNAGEQSSLLQDKSLELYDLSAASAEQLQQAAALAWQIKELFFDIQTGGTELLNQKLSVALNHTLDQRTLHRLVAALPRDTLLNNQREWFPNLAADVMRFRKAGRQVLAKPTLIAVVSPPASVTPPETVSSIDDDIDLGDDADIDLLAEDDDLVEADLTEDDDLSDDSLGSITDDDMGLGDLAEGDDDLLSEDDAPSDDLAEDDHQPVAAQVTLPEPVNAEDWALSGGWYRDGSNIRYRPTGHKDMFLKTWLDVASSSAGGLETEIYDALTAEQSVGRCTKCHVSDKGEHKAKMHWASFDPTTVKIRFNRFSHVSHFSLMTDDGCASCHTLNLDAQGGLETAKEQIAAGAEPAHAEGLSASFMSMKKETCTQCHQEGRAPAACLTCHEYHVERAFRSADQIPDGLNDRVE